MNLVDRAYQFAAKAHEGQMRKYTGDPYIVHPIMVVNILVDAGYDLESMLAAAYLHDVVEDCDVSITTIYIQFGVVTALEILIKHT